MTTRDLQAINEQLKQEDLAVKKCTAYGAQMNDPQLKTLASTLAQHHRQQFDRIFTYLNGQN